MFVVGTIQVGGSQAHLLNVASRLVQRGWRVSLCSLSGDGPLRNDLERAGVTVYVPPVDRDYPMNPVVRFLKLAVAACYLFGLFLRHRPKIVHFFLPRAYLTGAPLALLVNLPIRVMSRRSLNDYQASQPVLRRAERLCHKAMTAILGNSRSVSRQLRAEGVPSSRLATIYNGIDVDTFKEPSDKTAPRQALGIEQDRLVLSIVANLIPYKGHEDLLRALAMIRSSLPPKWRLLIVGRDYGIEQNLRELAFELGIGEHVGFLGTRTDVPRILGASDIGLSCSHEEGFSNAVLEAMACGLPMVVTGVGGNPEAVVDGETGIVVPAENSAALAEAIARLANDPELRLKYGRAGRARVTRHFSLDHCVGQYEVLYRALLDGRRPIDVPELRLETT